MEVLFASFNGLAASVFLLGTFGSLASRQMLGCVRFFRLQSVALSVSILVLAGALKAPELMVVAVFDLVLKPVIIPWLLTFYVPEELFKRREINHFINVTSSLLIALLLTVMSYFLVRILFPPVFIDKVSTINLLVGLAALLISAYTLGIRNEALPQLIAIFGIENAALLAGIVIAPDLPIVAEMAFSFDMLTLAVVLGILTRITKVELGLTELSAMRSLRESERQ